MRYVRWLLGSLVVSAVVFGIVLIAVFSLVPRSNTAQEHFDAIIVLGNQTRQDGTPSPEMRERTLEGVREYRAGVAPRLILTGGAAHARFVEAEVMAKLAASQGVPTEAIVLEPQAKDTIQNIWYSRAIMAEHGWKSAEVVSSAYHLPRTALILEHYHGDQGLGWKVHASPWPADLSRGHELFLDYREAFGLMKLRLNGFRHSRFLPE